MTTRRPLAPVVAGDESLPEVERVVLDALRKRALQHRAGMTGVASPAVTRGELVRALRAWSVLDGDGRPSFPLARVSDRRLRRAVEHLREAEHPVCSSSSVPGYWLSDDASEVRACAATLRARPSVVWALRRAAAAIDARHEEGAAWSPQGGLL